MLLIEKHLHLGFLSLVVNTMCILGFVYVIVKFDLPLSHLPVIGKHFRKQ
jgi:hypothetical protein